MKLLFLTPQLPFPPQQGTTIRNFNIIKQLASRHEIHLLSFGTSQELGASPLREYCSRIEIAPPPVRTTLTRAYETLSSPLPDMARRLHSPFLAQKLAAMLRQEKYDVIQIEGIEMAEAWRLETRGWNRAKSPVSSLRSSISVFDDHNAEWVLQKTAYETDVKNPRRWHGAFYSWIQWHKLAQFERKVCLEANRVVAVSAEDAQAIGSLDPRVEPVVIPNGVDVDFYVPSEEVCAKPLADRSVVFTGKMDFRPNIDAAFWFANDILPALRNEIPLAHVLFVGQKPTPHVLALKSRAGVQVTGWVPDTRPFIADAAVYAVPLRMGGGTRLKVLEAMAMGKAIVSTTRGVEGIASVDGRDVVIADTARDFAHAIAVLMRDKPRARELGGNARRLAEESYDWKMLIPQFDALYRH